MVSLQQGANAPVDDGDIVVEVACAGAVADATCYLLAANGRVRGDADMVFFNQPSAGGVSFRAGPPTAFVVALGQVPAAIERIVFCLTMEGGKSFSALQNCAVRLTSRTGEPRVIYEPATAGASEAAIILAELYRRNGQWKFRAVGQGFNGGLAPLARSFGIEVADDPAPSPPSAPRPVASPPVAPAVAPPASPPVSLSKISLDKRGQAVSLEKRGASFGEIVVNLNWSRGKRGLFGGGTAVDLDLGCLFELNDGHVGVVQAIGRQFGSFRDEPWIELSGDDRTGDVAQGETLRINGAHWANIRRVAVFALIYDGVPNWQSTDGVVSVTMPDQPPIEVRMTEGRNDRRLCGIVLFENDAGQMKLTRIVEYFRHQEELDRAHRFGLRWTAGSKD